MEQYLQTPLAVRLHTSASSTRNADARTMILSHHIGVIRLAPGAI
jgi:hypothetical protein